MTDKRAALRAERERALIRQGAGPTLNQVIASKLKTISAAATDAGDDGERVPLPPGPPLDTEDNDYRGNPSGVEMTKLARTLDGSNEELRAICEFGDALIALAREVEDHDERLCCAISRLAMTIQDCASAVIETHSEVIAALDPRLTEKDIQDCAAAVIETRSEVTAASDPRDASTGGTKF